MAEDEESQVAEDFGRMVRIATGSIMQVAESRARRRQVGASTDAAATRDRQRMEDNASRVVQHDLYRAEFWKHAGSESIADRMAVAATLGETNPAAQSAWMHGADVIRSTYGIDLQKINREHPNSQEERHAALRDALDDRFQMNRYDAEADRVRDAAEELGRPKPERENGPAAPEKVRGAETEAEVFQAAEKLEAKADRERMEEGESMERAERAEDAGRDVQPTLDTDGLAARREFARERAEEASAAPGDRAPSRMVDAAHERAADTGRVNLGQLEQSSPQMVQSRVRQLQSFALDPKQALAATKQHRRPRVHGNGTEQGRQEVLSR